VSLDQNESLRIDSPYLRRNTDAEDKIPRLRPARLTAATVDRENKITVAEYA
jgi:hypothetical protein